jgi:hypothetical protein
MAKNKVKIETVINDLKSLFNTENNEFGTIESDGKFYIQKKQFGRGTVIEKLQNYFSDKFIDGGYCSVGNITMVFTSFEILEGTPT